MPQTFHIRHVGQQRLLDFAELWSFRHLFRTIVWRTIRVRYQQTVIGMAWALLQPLLLTFVFTIIFGRPANIPTNGQPYPIFVLSGLLVWLFVAQAFNQASISIVANAHLVTKIYFPRVILIVAAITAAIFDFLCSFVLLIVLMVWYGIAPSVGALVFGSIRQAALLSERIVSREIPCSVETLSLLERFAACAQEGRLRRLWTVSQLGLRRQGVFRQLLLYSRLLVSSRGAVAD
jgi:ABC-2 family transporter